jgi:putative hydrolase of the HAD superfamily
MQRSPEARMRRIDAVFFDLGDTLVDLGEGRGEYEALLSERAERVYLVLQEAGVAPTDRPGFCLAIAEHTESCYQRALAAERGITLSAVLSDLFRMWRVPVSDELIDAAVAAYSGGGGVSRPLRAGAMAVLEALRADGLKLGIISNTIQPASSMDRSLDRRGVLDFFAVRVYSSEHPWAKPHPAIFQHALAALGVDPGRAVHVGDRLEADTLGAHRAGMLAVHIVAERRSQGWREIVPDATICELPELLEVLPRLADRM